MKRRKKHSDSLRSTASSLSSDQRFLAFSLSDENYAVPLLKVLEVIALPDITPVPFTPPHFKGIMNLRGMIISVVDFRIKFGMEKAAFGPQTAVVIMDLSPIRIGIIVDSVNSVLALGPEQMSPAPETEASVKSDTITSVARVGKKLVLVLDIDKALGVEDLVALRRMTPGAPHANAV